MPDELQLAHLRQARGRCPERPGGYRRLSGGRGGRGLGRSREAHRPAVGPGALLLHEQLRDAFDRGLEAVDLLGHTDPFKRSWAHGADDRIRVHAFRRNPMGMLHWSRVAAREGARPAVSWMRARMRSASARAHHVIGSLAAQWERLPFASGRTHGHRRFRAYPGAGNCAAHTDARTRSLVRPQFVSHDSPATTCAPSSGRRMQNFGR